jgi:DNA-directed RNA polymerase specialized sigma24 family protein
MTRSARALLPRADREALLLVYWEQLTYAEAAETLGCSVNAIGIRVHKAKARLRERRTPPACLPKFPDTSPLFPRSQARR